MAHSRTIHLADVLVGPGFEPTGPCDLTIENGRIAKVEKRSETPAGRQLLGMPSLTDAHNHARPLSTTSFGAGMKPLEAWLPSLVSMPSVDPYLATAASFGRSVRGGCTGAMAHITRPMGLTPLPEEAREVGRAAADTGLAIGFGIGMRDRNPLVYGDHTRLLDGLPAEAQARVRATWLQPMPDIRTQLEIVDAVAEVVFENPLVDVQYAPNGVQWCSDDFLSAIADASERNGRRVHMHLLETRPQRIWADQAYPKGIVRHLADVGLLSPRLTLAHCVWARPEELDLIAEHGARISVNPSSNLHLSSGIAPVAQMKAAGVAFGMGLDGCAFDEDDDALRELRLFRLLNGGWGFDRDLSPADVLTAACSTGRAAIGQEAGGVIAPGMPADLLLLDLDRLDRDKIMPVDPRHYLFARATQGHIVEVLSGGLTLQKDGRLARLNLAEIEDELRAQYRVGMKTTADARLAFAAVEDKIEDFYKGCC